MLGEAMNTAKRPEEKKAVLSQVQRINSPEALALAQSALNDPDVAAEAKAAVNQIQRRMAPRRPQ